MSRQQSLLDAADGEGAACGRSTSSTASSRQRRTVSLTQTHFSVPLKVAQTWSGHKTLSVLLDTCYGVMQHDDPPAGRRGQLDRACSSHPSTVVRWASIQSAASCTMSASV